MMRQDFIDALYNAGWDAVGDAQHGRIAEFHRELFPTTAALEDERRGLVEEAHQAGQAEAGINPCRLSAREYATNVGI